jgi:hypothetical protein
MIIFTYSWFLTIPILIKSQLIKTIKEYRVDLNNPSSIAPGNRTIGTCFHAPSLITLSADNLGLERLLSEYGDAYPQEGRSFEFNDSIK